MNLIQQSLEWAYIFICFVVIWYSIAFITAIWQWLLRQISVDRVVSPLGKLIAVLLVARGIVWLGVMTST